MNILDRWRLIRMKRDLSALMAEDPLLSWKTTEDLMARMCVRAEQIAMLRFNIRRIEGGDDPDDPDDPDDTRIPSGLHCPTTKPEQRP